MFARCPLLRIHARQISRGVLRQPAPHARFSPTNQARAPRRYPTRRNRETMLPPEREKWLK